MRSRRKRKRRRRRSRRKKWRWQGGGFKPVVGRERMMMKRKGKRIRVGN